MLSLRDFFHLPQVDPLLNQVAGSPSGLILVAGPDPRPGILAGGRSAIFQILLEEILAVRKKGRCLVVAGERPSVRVPRGLRRRIEILPGPGAVPEPEAIDAAARRGPGLLAVDRLNGEAARSALDAARQGLLVLAQLDTLFWGGEAVLHLLDLGVPEAELEGLAWIITVHRTAKQCPECRQPIPAHALAGQIPGEVQIPLSGDFYQASGCAHCRQSGRQGDIAVFDIFQAGSSDAAELISQPSRLSMESYLWQLAALGHISPADCRYYKTRLFQKTFELLGGYERSLAEANALKERLQAEIEAAFRVLEQRTRSLIALQDLGQALTSSIDLDGLAERICERALELCGADRVILYYQHSPEDVEILAVGGWEAALLHQRLHPRAVFVAGNGLEPVPFHHPPPGVLPHIPLLEGVVLRAGLYVPLVAPDEHARGRRVGLMIVHTTQKSAFSPAEQSLLQTFAHQAALALQRSGLIEKLQAQIVQLEEAQAELVKKERLDRDMELARQVQQRMLPRTFPEAPGFQFAARNEPARQVGGDFYDVIALDDDHFGVVIADVSDKGLPSALYMALTRSLILAEARRNLSPHEVLVQVNRLLQELGEPDMFVTVFYGVIERSTRRLTYTRAGHEVPFIIRAGETLRLEGRGNPLGILDGESFQASEEQLDLLPGDRLVLYTDGLTDIFGPSGHLFGREHLKSVVLARSALELDEMCAAIFSDLTAAQGGGEQYDDMTLLIVEAVERGLDADERGERG